MAVNLWSQDLKVFGGLNADQLAEANVLMFTVAWATESIIIR